MYLEISLNNHLLDTVCTGSCAKNSRGISFVGSRSRRAMDRWRCCGGSRCRTYSKMQQWENGQSGGIWILILCFVCICIYVLIYYVRAWNNYYMLQKNIFIIYIPLGVWVQVKTNASKVHHKDTEVPEGGVDDMTKLAYLHEPGVLQNLKSRYFMNEIYVSAASCCVFSMLSYHIIYIFMYLAILPDLYRKHIDCCKSFHEITSTLREQRDAAIQRCGNRWVESSSICNCRRCI